MKCLFFLLLFVSTAHAQVDRDSSVVIQSYGFQSLNPITSTDGGSAYVYSEIYESLNYVDPRSLKLIPSLADLPVVSKDHLEYTYRLNPKAKWSDGKSVTVDDVIFSFKAAMNPALITAAYLRNYFLDVKSIEEDKADKLRFTVKLERANPWHPMVLGGGYLLILPKHIWDPKNNSDKIGWDEVRQSEKLSESMVAIARDLEDPLRAVDPKFIVGSGPYVLTSYEEFSSVILTRDDRYWAKGMPRKEAYPKHIVFEPIYDEDEAREALLAGKIDILDNLNLAHFRGLDTTKYRSLVKATAPYNNYSFLALNNDNPLFADKNVRKAIAAAIDRQAIQQEVLKGEGKLSENPVAFTQTNFNPRARQEAYDLKRSKKMLKEAGWKDSDNDGILDKEVDGKKLRFSFTAIVNAGNVIRRQVLESVVVQLKAVGIEVRIEEMEWSQYLERSHRADYEMLYGAWAGNATEDDIHQLWHSSHVKNKGSNYYRYRSEAADRLLEQIQMEFDEKKRYALHHRLQEVIAEDQPVIFLFSLPLRIVWNKRLENVELFRQRPCYDPRYFKIGSRK